MTPTYCFADRVIGINSLYPYIHDYCRDYLILDQIADFVVTTSEADIAYERDRSVEEHGGVWRDDYLETLAVYRKIAERMPAFDTILFHGSCVAVDGMGYLFTAASGTGKSTHARLWRELLRERAVMINDDKPLIRITDSEAVIYGTPWDGKHRLSTNASVPLAGICILERDVQNHIERITPKEAMPMLIQQTYRPADTAMLIKTLELIEKLSDRASLYHLGCNMEPEAAMVSYEAMKG